MKFTNLAILVSSLGAVVAHPERATEEVVKREAKLIGRSTNHCAAAIEKRKADILAKRSASLHARRAASGLVSREAEHKYTTIQNDTCVLAPDTIWGPYGVDGEMVRYDLREEQKGIDFYLDIGVLDVETCEPLEATALSIWMCNATGSYASFTGIDPDTSELLDGYTKGTDGTTDNETFLRGIQITDSEGMVEFLTKFPGYYVTRTTHIHVTAQTNITNGTFFSQSKVQHIGQLFFEEDILNSVYSNSPYVEHLSTLNRTTNSEDKLFSTASSDGYSAVISVNQLGDSVLDGLVGYITIGVNASAAGIATTGNDVNPQGWLPTVSLDAEKYPLTTSASS